MSVFDGANHSTLRPQCACVGDVEGLAGQQAEVKPLEQFGHHNLGFHLHTQTHIHFKISRHLISVCLSVCVCVCEKEREIAVCVGPHLCKVLSQARSWS